VHENDNLQAPLFAGTGYYECVSGSCRLAALMIDRCSQPTSQFNAPVKEGQRAESSRRASASETEIGTAFSRQ
jgi:hypothetical protein